MRPFLYPRDRKARYNAVQLSLHGCGYESGYESGFGLLFAVAMGSLAHNPLQALTGSP